MKRMSFGLVLLTAGLAACGSKNNGFGIAVMVPHDASAAALTAAPITTTPGPGGLTISDGTSTLVVTEAKLVLSEIELEAADDEGACAQTTTSGQRAGCEDVEAGSTVVTLPLDGSVSEQITANVAPGSYDKTKLKVHVLGDDDGDHAAATATPDMQNASVKVAGTFDGASFVYYGKVEAEQEVELSPPMVVADGSSTAAITLSVDMSTWFASAGALVDPRTAGPDGANRELVDHNIETSIGGFEDDDHDGTPHDHDSDEH